MNKTNNHLDIKGNEDKIKFLYRTIELLRLEHNEKGKDFREKKISEIEWNNYVKNSFEPRSKNIFSTLNQLNDKLGINRIDPSENLDDPRLKLKADGKKETKWDTIIDIKKIQCL